MLGKNLFYFMDDQGITRANKLLEKRRQGIKEQHDFEFIKKSGDRVYLLLETIPLTDDKNNYAGALASAMDITERKESEIILKENKARLESLVHVFQKAPTNKEELFDITLHEAITLSNSENGCIHFYNNATEKFNLFSWIDNEKKEELIENQNRSCNMNNADLWLEAIKQKKPIIKNNLNSYNNSIRKCSKNNSELHRTLAIPLLVDNNISTILCLSNKKSNYTERDILHLTILLENSWTVLQKIERDNLIKKQNLELEKLNNDKDRFMSILAHDLKNPILGITNATELLIENVNKNDTDQIKEWSKLINDTSHTTSKLLKDLLVWSRAQKGELSYTPFDFNIHQACELVLKDTIGMSSSKDIIIHNNIPNEILVFSDINLVRTVLRNLISNAIKFTPKKGIITIKAEERETDAIVSVSDTGIGMKKEVLTQIFDISVKRTSLGTEKEKGSGLGLQICKEFVDKMGGKIWVESEPNKGSTFYFTIPKNEVTEKKEYQ